MKRSAVLFAMLAVAGSMLAAQETASTPVAEVGMNFSFVQLYPGGGSPSFTSAGGSGTFIYNLNRSIGLVADLGGYHNGSETNFTPTTFSYLFGPRLNLRKSSRFTPYVQALFGGARVSTDFLDPNSGNTLTQNGFASAYGGGTDVRVTDHFAVKPFQVEYLRTHLPNVWTSNSQNNLRYSAGVVFRFGSK